MEKESQAAHAVIIINCSSLHLVLDCFKYEFASDQRLEVGMVLETRLTIHVL